MRRFLILQCAALCFCAPAPGDVILNSGGQTVLRAAVRDTNVSFTETTSTLEPAALPYTPFHSAGVGAASSNNSYGFTNSGFNISMNHSRPGKLDSNSGTGGDIFFSVSAPTVYKASGSYTAVDTNPRHVNLDALLVDLTTSQTLLNSHQRSITTANETFVLGQMGGDSENIFTGSLTGNLLVGHQYKFTYQGQIYANSTDDGAAGSGTLKLEYAPLTCTDVLSASSLSIPTVKTDAFNGRLYIESIFTPKVPKMTVRDAAAVCGVDHFNFVQYIKSVPVAWTVTDNAIETKHSGSPLSPPLIDPLPGNGSRVIVDPRSGRVAHVDLGPGFMDNNVSYWDDSDVTTPSALSGTSLAFQDEPSVLDGMFANSTGADGETVRFYTQLVGVDEAGNVVRYYGDSLGIGFTWYSNQFHDFSGVNGGNVYLSTLPGRPDLPPVIGGSIYGIEMVPEPTSTAFVFVIALFMLPRNRSSRPERRLLRFTHAE